MEEAAGITCSETFCSKSLAVPCLDDVYSFVSNMSTETKIRHLGISYKMIIRIVFFLRAFYRCHYSQP